MLWPDAADVRNKYGLQLLLVQYCFWCCWWQSCSYLSYFTRLRPEALSKLKFKFYSFNVIIAIHIALTQRFLALFVLFPFNNLVYPSQNVTAANTISFCVKKVVISLGRYCSYIAFDLNTKYPHLFAQRRPQTCTYLKSQKTLILAKVQNYWLFEFPIRMKFLLWHAEIFPRGNPSVKNACINTLTTWFIYRMLFALSTLSCHSVSRIQATNQRRIGSLLQNSAVRLADTVSNSPDDVNVQLTIPYQSLYVICG